MHIAHTLCANFSLNAHTLCANFGLNAHSLGNYMTVLKIRKYFYAFVCCVQMYREHIFDHRK